MQTLGRRAFLRATAAGLGGPALPRLAREAAGTATRPNIVLIFADDLGWKDIGYQGIDFHETPNIDRLSREGMVFSAGYAAAGNCMPSRACCCPVSTRRVITSTP